LVHEATEILSSKFQNLAAIIYLINDTEHLQNAKPVPVLFENFLMKIQNVADAKFKE